MIKLIGFRRASALPAVWILLWHEDRLGATDIFQAIRSNMETFVQEDTVRPSTTWDV